MHRTISVKYRIVRRVDIDKAPLATFDTVDLGDDDVQLASQKPDSQKPDSLHSDSQKPDSQKQDSLQPDSHQSVSTEVTVKSEESQHHISKYNKQELFICDGILKSETIGGSSSKKSLTQAGGEEREGRDERAKDRLGCVVDDNVPGPFLGQGTVSEVSRTESRQPDSRHLEEVPNAEPNSSNREGSLENDVPSCTVIPTLPGHKTIGRVHVPIKKQDSDSSSSSPSSCNDAAFTFQASESSACPPNGTGADGPVGDTDDKRDIVDNLVPEFLDPSQILSPSKRKAYERRIERLKVTTSPIARPRSTTPINVVTLDEYAVISSPETCPATAFIVQDKLKITLPTDEFTSKPKTPKLPTAKKHNIEDTCFEFTEEFLFSRTKAALVVADDGQLPLSPRRVLIPPNLTPTTSPKLSASPKLTPDSFYEDLTPDTPYLKEIQEIEATRKFFGTTIDESEEDNWADFHDICQADDNEDNDTSTSTVCDTNEAEVGGSVLLAEDWTTPGVAADSLFAESVPFTSGCSHLDVLEEFLVCQPEDGFDARAPTVSSDPDLAVTEYENSSRYSEIFHQSILETDPDLAHPEYSGSTSISPLDAAHHAIDPDLESEEIITIEINQSTESQEKHIGIEIRSTGNSASVSPICSEWSTGQRSPNSDTFRAVSEETPGFQQDFSVLSLSSDSASSPALNNGNYPARVENTCALQNGKAHVDRNKSPLGTDITLTEVHETQPCMSSPIFDSSQTSFLETTQPDFLPLQLPPYQYSLQQTPQPPPRLTDEAPPLPPRPQPPPPPLTDEALPLTSRPQPPPPRLTDEAPSLPSHPQPPPPQLTDEAPSLPSRPQPPPPRLTDEAPSLLSRPQPPPPRLTDEAPSFLSRPQQPPPRLTDEAPPLPPRPPSTNPFDIDYEPLGSNPFAVELQNPCTNPFLEHTPMSSDLINFSFTTDSSSA